uniref:Uncharacterized protein TCIL3000_6_2990 n=1 Tax=Trypanosoma congolense (strain IL3000) TaxID=1068625 RepID=G0UNU2_TRYCI|nr:unnamed protein product [Trypanosoma congolense IL3000]
MFGPSDTVDDARTVQLLAEIDLQVERMAKRHGFGPQQGRQLKPVSESTEGAALVSPPKCRFTADHMAPAVRNVSGPAAPMSAEGPEASTFSTLLNRVEMLEERLRVSEEEKSILTRRLASIEQLLGEVMDSKKIMQGGRHASSKHDLEMSPVSYEQDTGAEPSKMRGRKYSLCDCATQSNSSSITGLSAFPSPAKKTPPFDSKRSSAEHGAKNSRCVSTLKSEEVSPTDRQYRIATERRLFALNDLAQRLSFDGLVCGPKSAG